MKYNSKLETLRPRQYSYEGDVIVIFDDFKFKERVKLKLLYPKKEEYLVKQRLIQELMYRLENTRIIEDKLLVPYENEVLIREKSDIKKFIVKNIIIKECKAC